MSVLSYFLLPWLVIWECRPNPRNFHRCYMDIFTDIFCSLSGLLCLFKGLDALDELMSPSVLVGSDIFAVVISV